MILIDIVCGSTCLQDHSRFSESIFYGYQCIYYTVPMVIATIAAAQLRM